MAEVSWISFTHANPDTEYLALVSYLPRKGFLSIFGFLSETRAIQEQLESSEGLIGYSLRTQLIGKDAWTVSVWRDEEALVSFVRKSPHIDTMRNLKPRMGRTKFVRWKITGSEVPPKWDDALRRLET